MQIGKPLVVPVAAVDVVADEHHAAVMVLERLRRRGSRPLAPARPRRPTATSLSERAARSGSRSRRRRSRRARAASGCWRCRWRRGCSPTGTCRRWRARRRRRGPISCTYCFTPAPLEIDDRRVAGAVLALRARARAASARQISLPVALSSATRAGVRGPGRHDQRGRRRRAATRSTSTSTSPARRSPRAGSSASAPCRSRRRRRPGRPRCRARKTRPPSTLGVPARPAVLVAPHRADAGLPQRGAIPRVERQQRAGPRRGHPGVDASATDGEAREAAPEPARLPRSGGPAAGHCVGEARSRASAVAVRAAPARPPGRPRRADREGPRGSSRPLRTIARLLHAVHSFGRRLVTSFLGVAGPLVERTRLTDPGRRERIDRTPAPSHECMKRALLVARDARRLRAAPGLLVLAQLRGRSCSGFVPIGLFYHACYAVGASLLMWLLVTLRLARPPRARGRAPHEDRRAVIPTLIVFVYLAIVLYIGVFAFRQRPRQGGSRGLLPGQSLAGPVRVPVVAVRHEHDGLRDPGLVGPRLRERHRHLRPDGLVVGARDSADAAS